MKWTIVNLPYYAARIISLMNYILKLFLKLDNLFIEGFNKSYLKLIGQIPEINDLIPQFHIASYLGITPVQLSRIRKKLGHN